MARHQLYLAVSCRPPRGAWSWRRVQPDGHFLDHQGTEAHASAWRLRLHALVSGLENLVEGTEVEVVTTDAQTITMCERWLPAWEQRGFEKKGGIQDVDLVKRLAPQLHRHQVHFRHQPRRTGDPHAKDTSRHAKAAADRMEVPAVASTDLVEVRGDVQVVAWTDGGSRKNPGPSGWGAVMVHLATGTTLTLRGGTPEATNNRMELTAIAEALDAFQRRVRVEVRTDSRFSIQVCTEWRHGWKRRGWKRSNGEPPVNLDVIQRLDGLLERHDVVFTWVPGHSGEPGNERADALCNEAIDKVLAGQDASLRERAEAPPFEIRQA